MFKFATKLFMAKAFNLEQGEIKIFNQPVVMLPADVQIYLIHDLAEKFGVEKGLKVLYNAAKKGTFEYCENLKKNTNSKGMELSELYKGIVTLAGYGIAEITRFDPAEKVVICKFSNSPLVNGYKRIFGKSDFPVDVFTLGLFAGSYNSLFNVDYDAIETKCGMLGHEYCEFLYAAPDKLSKVVVDKGIKRFF